MTARSTKDFRNYPAIAMDHNHNRADGTPCCPWQRNHAMVHQLITKRHHQWCSLFPESLLASVESKALRFSTVASNSETSIALITSILDSDYHRRCNACLHSVLDFWFDDKRIPSFAQAMLKLKLDL